MRRSKHWPVSGIRDCPGQFEPGIWWMATLRTWWSNYPVWNREWSDLETAMDWIGAELEQQNEDEKPKTWRDGIYGKIEPCYRQSEHMFFIRDRFLAIMISYNWILGGHGRPFERRWRHGSRRRNPHHDRIRFFCHCAVDLHRESLPEKIEPTPRLAPRWVHVPQPGREQAHPSQLYSRVLPHSASSLPSYHILIQNGIGCEEEYNGLLESKCFKPVGRPTIPYRPVSQNNPSGWYPSADAGVLKKAQQVALFLVRKRLFRSVPSAKSEPSIRKGVDPASRAQTGRILRVGLLPSRLRRAGWSGGRTQRLGCLRQHDGGNGL